MNRKPSSTIHLQPRDEQLLAMLSAIGALRLSQVADVFFDGRGEAAKKRLQRLRTAGHLITRSSRFTPTIVLSARHHRPTGQASTTRRHIEHQIDVADVLLAFVRAVNGHPQDGASLAFTCNDRLAQLHREPILPDACVRISMPSQAPADFFLELDRSTETQLRLVKKADAYRTYYRSGQFAVRKGASVSEYRSYPFRVLLVLKSVERRDNTARSLLHAFPPHLSLVWLTTFPEVTRDPLGPIWLRPIDYGDAPPSRVSAHHDPYTDFKHPLLGPTSREAPPVAGLIVA